jgi:hypothetical protein
VLYFGARRMRTLAANDLVNWYAEQGASAWSVKGRWTAL